MVSRRLPIVFSSSAIALSTLRSRSGSPSEAAYSLASRFTSWTTFLTTHLPGDLSEGQPSRGARRARPVSSWSPPQRVESALHELKVDAEELPESSTAD